MEYKFPSSLPAGAQDLISKLLRYNPSERLSLAHVLKHPWVKEHSHMILPPCSLMAFWALSVFIPTCFFGKLSSLNLLLHVLCLFSLL